MKINQKLFSGLIALRQSLRVDEEKFSPKIELNPLDELRAIELELESDGIEVAKSDIEIIGPFLTYKGAHAILYIKDSQRTSEDLLDERVTKNAPKFHTSWCRTLEDMESRGRFSRYILSRRKNNRFLVTARERDPSLIARYDEYHDIEDVVLYTCKNCLKKINYKGYGDLTASEAKDKAVSEFSIKEFLEENEGVLAPMRFYRAQYSDVNAPHMGYTDNWPEISRSHRERANWTCTECGVNMSSKKGGLHVHHIDGAKYNNSAANLKVLCAVCHKNQPHHGNMHVAKDIVDFINRNRP